MQPIQSSKYSKVHMICGQHQNCTFVRFQPIQNNIMRNNLVHLIAIFTQPSGYYGICCSLHKYSLRTRRRYSSWVWYNHIYMITMYECLTGQAHDVDQADSWLCHLLAVLAWISSSRILSFSIVFHKTGEIIAISS